MARAIPAMAEAAAEAGGDNMAEIDPQNLTYDDVAKVTIKKSDGSSYNIPYSVAKESGLVSGPEDFAKAVNRTGYITPTGEYTTDYSKANFRTSISLNKDTKNVEIDAPSIFFSTQTYKEKIKPVLEAVSQNYKLNPEYKYALLNDESDTKNSEDWIKEIEKELPEWVSSTLSNQKVKDQVKQDTGLDLTDEQLIKMSSVALEKQADGSVVQVKDDTIQSLPEIIKKLPAFKNLQGWKNGEVTYKDLMESWNREHTPDEDLLQVYDEVADYFKKGEFKDADEYAEMVAFSQFIEGKHPETGFWRGAWDGISDTFYNIWAGTAKFDASVLNTLEGVANLAGTAGTSLAEGKWTGKPATGELNFVRDYLMPELEDQVDKFQTNSMRLNEAAGSVGAIAYELTPLAMQIAIGNALGKAAANGINSAAAKMIAKTGEAGLIGVAEGGMTAEQVATATLNGTNFLMRVMSSSKANGLIAAAVSTLKAAQTYTAVVSTTVDLAAQIIVDVAVQDSKLARQLIDGDVDNETKEYVLEQIALDAGGWAVAAGSIKAIKGIGKTDVGRVLNAAVVPRVNKWAAKIGEYTDSLKTILLHSGDANWNKAKADRLRSRLEAEMPEGWKRTRLENKIGAAERRQQNLTIRRIERLGRTKVGELAGVTDGATSWTEVVENANRIKRESDEYFAAAHALADRVYKGDVASRVSRIKLDVDSLDKALDDYTTQLTKVSRLEDAAALKRSTKVIDIGNGRVLTALSRESNEYALGTYRAKLGESAEKILKAEGSPTIGVRQEVEYYTKATEAFRNKYPELAAELDKLRELAKQVSAATEDARVFEGVLSEEELASRRASEYFKDGYIRTQRVQDWEAVHKRGAEYNINYLRDNQHLKWGFEGDAPREYQDMTFVLFDDVNQVAKQSIRKDEIGYLSQLGETVDVVVSGEDVARVKTVSPTKSRAMKTIQNTTNRAVKDMGNATFADVFEYKEAKSAIATAQAKAANQGGKLAKAKVKIPKVTKADKLSFVRDLDTQNLDDLILLDQTSPFAKAIETEEDFQEFLSGLDKKTSRYLLEAFDSQADVLFPRALTKNEQLAQLPIFDESSWLKATGEKKVPAWAKKYVAKGKRGKAALSTSERPLIMENGEPKTFYHGSPNEAIDEFDISKAGRNARTGEKAIFFTDDWTTANNEFSFERVPTDSLLVDSVGKQGKVHQRYLSMNNPLDLGKLTDKQINELWEYADDRMATDGKRAFVKRMKEFRNSNNDQLIKGQLDLGKLKDSEYDGIIARMYPNQNEVREYAVFDSKNIVDPTALQDRSTSGGQLVEDLTQIDELRAAIKSIKEAPEVTHYTLENLNKIIQNDQDFLTGLKRQYVMNNKTILDDPKVAEVIGKIKQQEAIFDAETLYAQNIKDLQKLKDEFNLPGMATDLNQKMDDVIDKIIATNRKDDVTVKALKSLDDSDDIIEYATLKSLTDEKNLKETSKKLKAAAKKEYNKTLTETNKVEKDGKVIKKMTGDQINKAAEQWADQTAEWYEERVNQRFAQVTNRLREAGSDVVDYDDLFGKIDAINKEITDAGKTTDIVKTYDDIGREEYVRLSPTVANLITTMPTPLRRGMFGEIQAEFVKVFRMGTTGGLVPQSLIRQWFRDSGLAITGGNMTRTMSEVQEQLTKVYGSTITDYYQKYMPDMWETLLGKAEETGESVEQLAAKQEMLRARTYAPDQMQSKLYQFRNQTRIAKGKDGIYEKSVFDNMGTKLEKAMMKTEKLNNMRETNRRIWVYNNAYLDALNNGHSVPMARRYAEMIQAEATTNFSRQAYHLANLTHTVPYLGSAINGSKSFWRLMAIDPVGITTRIVGGYLVPMIALTNLSLSDPENREVYKSIPEYEKDDNLVFVMNGQKISIPVPQEVSSLLRPIQSWIEAMQGANDHSLEELTANNIAGFFPYELQGFVNIDSDRILVNDDFEGVLQNHLLPGFSMLSSQMMAPLVKSGVMWATGYDPYTRKRINTAYTTTDPLTGESVIIDYKSGGLAKLLGSIFKGNFNVSAEMAQAVFNNLLGTGNMNIIDGLTDIALAVPTGKSIGEGLTDATKRMTEATLKPLIIPTYGEQSNQAWKRAVNQLYREKEAIINDPEYQADIKAIASGDMTEDAKNKALGRIKTKKEEFQERVLNAAQNLIKNYDGGTIDRYKFASIISLMAFSNGYNPDPTDPLSKKQSKESYNLAKAKAIETMAQMGFNSPSDNSIFGYYEKNDKTGEIAVQFYSPLAILDFEESQKQQSEVALANIQAAVNEAELWKAHEAIEKQTNAIYDKGKLSKQDRANIDAIYINWNAQVAKTLAPYVTRMTPEAAINNADVRNYLYSLIEVPGAWEVNDKGRYVSLGDRGNKKKAYYDSWVKSLFGVNDPYKGQY